VAQTLLFFFIGKLRPARRFFYCSAIHIYSLLSFISNLISGKISVFFSSFVGASENFFLDISSTKIGFSNFSSGIFSKSGTILFIISLKFALLFEKKLLNFPAKNRFKDFL